LKLGNLTKCREVNPSPPARGAWIETLVGVIVGFNISVAPRAGGVD